MPRRRFVLARGSLAAFVLARLLGTLSIVMTAGVGAGADARQAGPPRAPSPAELQGAIDKLGNLDYAVRTSASKIVRRTPLEQAVPALLNAATEHTDGYVRFRALVLLAGFNDPRATDAMRAALADPNDRLREVAYGFFEHHPDPTLSPILLKALDREEADFVRPRLVRALAAHGSTPAVQQALVREAGRGQDFFRSAVIEALGDYRAGYAQPALTAIVELDGPLRDDGALAIGKIGDRQSLPVLADLQRRAPRESQPAVAAAICLLGVNCGTQLGFLSETLRFAEKNPGFQELMRGTAAGLGALGVRGNIDAVNVLLEVGIPSQDPARAPIALAVATVAIRNPSFMLGFLEKYPARDGAIDVLRDGFDMLEEDFEEEQFFAAVRRGYWSARDGSPARSVAEALITRLDF